MKKINKIAIYTSLVATILATGCKKEFLEVSPTTSIKASEAFTTPERIAAGLTGLYDLTTLSSYTHDMILNADIKGNDILVISSGNYSRFLTGYQYNQNFTSAEPLAYWNQGYRIIAGCNQFELNIPTSPLTAGEKTAYLAETRALRAEAYFWLVRWFGKPYTVDPEALGVPLVLAPLGPTDVPPLRNKVKEVYAQIVADLLYAEANIPTSKTSVYRFTKAAIQGYLARVYLTMGNYTEASKYAKLARASKPLNTAAALLTGFNNPTSEWIYALNVRTDDNQGFLQVHSFYEPYDIGYSTFRAADNFFDSFAANDERKKQFLVKSSPTAAASTATYHRRGTEGWLINKFDFTTTAATNTVLIRSSEMYLIEAEAEARLGVANEPAAKLALQAIQARAIPGTLLSLNTGQALIDEILTERNKELYGEGHKFFDLLRTKTPIVRLATNGHWLALNLPVGDNRLVFPIPQAELNANPLLKPQQNPGYAN
ncbi:RagB/SusD family nutrient uptake outer membrane protein [Pedobacter polaris]|uniref:RagB/SusD family nutrient uptake outer membrane protein n=1 Tax=Pedobacter polaris TaxID=2571273 RepID=A0A4U1CWT3_9SPHI|nr:RagB/SusD family nutrient uptake outer membrane protein [Pedobacter polaris]TKC12740.1 RagB/SusD family nutrient uptake outer membrane protein [Pedobacter polaris]